MNVDRYKHALLRLQATLSAQEKSDTASAKAQIVDSAGDVGDVAVADGAISEAFSQAELNAASLKQIGDALQRIEDGTYGRCVVDGAPIEATRLDAAPWAAYCITHQRLLEAGSRPNPTA